MKCALSCISQGDSYHWNRYECNQNPSHTHFNIIYQHQDSDIYIIYTTAASSWELNNKIFLYHCNQLLRLISRNTNYNYNTIELSKLPKIIFGLLQKRGNYTNWIKSLAQLKLTVFENDALWSTIETLFFLSFFNSYANPIAWSWFNIRLCAGGWCDDECRHLHWASDHVVSVLSCKLFTRASPNSHLAVHHTS